MVLGFAACQTEPDITTNMGDEEVNFKFAVDVAELATRAGDTTPQQGRNSAYGAIDYLQGSQVGDNCIDWSDVDLRYSLEVYDVDPEGLYGDNFAPIKDRQVIIVDEYAPVSFDLRLIPNREYHFAIFADFVGENASDDPAVDVQQNLGLRHIIGNTLKDITIKDEAINDELADAYFASTNITITNPTTRAMVLTRPYAKVRVVTTDLAELNLNVDPGKVVVEFETGAPTQFNALTGAIAGASSTKTFEYTYDNGVCKLVDNTHTGLATHLYTEGYDNYNNYGTENTSGEKRHTHMTLVTDYILATDQQTPINFTMSVYDKSDVLIKETNFSTDIPVQRNYLTTIIGNLLTSATQVNVTIDDNFANADNWTDEPFYVQLWDGTSVSEPTLDTATQTYHITKASELAWLATADTDTLANKTILLAEDIDLNNEPWTPVGTSDKPFQGTFDGNGKSIYNLAATGDYAAFIAYAAEGTTIKNLNLVDVAINSNKYAAGVVCNGDDNITIENVTVSGSINATSYAAGICHNLTNVTITNCQNNADITATRAAGIASWITGANTVVDNVVNNGDIAATWGAAGIVNRVQGSVSNATNNGTISSVESEPAAGVVCILTGATTFEYCYNYGDVTSHKANPNASAAGILGQTPGSTATLNYCANYGNITAEHSYAAGIAYSLYGTINASYCYNNGTIIGDLGAGGIAPKAQYGTGDKANYCLNAGELTSANGTTYQGSKNNLSCFYYNANNELLDVTTNTIVTTDDALASLNGGADNSFFEVANGIITVTE